MRTLSPHTQVQTYMKNADIHLQVTTERSEVYYNHTYLGMWLEWAKLWIQFFDKGQANVSPLISKNIKACTNYKSPTQDSSNHCQ